MASPAIAADLAPWVCNTTESMTLSLVRPGSDGESRQEFKPLFTYPIFGEREVVFGYKKFSIQLQFASGSLRIHPRIDYASQWQPSSSSSATVTQEIPAADDIMGMLKDYLPSDCISNSDEFARIVQQDHETFQPIGEKVHEYSRETEDGQEIHFELYRSTFVNEQFREYHRRMRIFVLLFIEGASYIEDDDEKWEVFTVFNRQGKGESASYHFVGFCTAYPHFFWPECTRFRISQFVILPPYQNQGHGSELYRFIYQTCMARSDVKEMPVEDPNDEFSDMRDKNDLRYLREHHAFDDLKAPVSREKIKELSSKFKLTERQFQRCLEMHLLSQVNKLDRQAYKQFRLQVKRRLYLFNLDALRTLDPEDRKEKLHQTYEGVIEDYHRLLEIV